MPFYLSRFKGTGQVDDSFMPEVVDPTTGAWGLIDLRGDVSQRLNGACIVWTEKRPATDPTTSVYLGIDLDAPLGNPQAQRVSTILGITFNPANENTLRTIITAMLTKYSSYSRSDRPKRLQGRQIRLGIDSWDI